MFPRVSLALLLCLAGSAYAAIDTDLITELPGWNQTFPSKQYSGYLQVSQAKFLHYWFVESENDPSTDPVVLWFNGGPGCSSLDGYFYEQGPFHFQDPMVEGARVPTASGSVPALTLNPNRWNKVANVIFLEAPAGVGFSYSTEPLANDDNSTAVDNLHAVLQFFKGFPEYVANDFYVTGESYAGIYVPTAVNQIRLYNDNAPSIPINLKGFMVGNGCIGSMVGACSAQGTLIRVKFLFGHGLYSQSLHTQILAACGNFTTPNTQCLSLLEQMGNEVGNVNIYDIYTPCIRGGLQSEHAYDRPARSLEEWTARASPFSRALRVPPSILDMALSPEGPDECIDGIQASAYLNDASVRAAIHVRPSSEIGAWQICRNVNYTRSTESLLPLYPTLIKQYRTVIYNGDVDSCVPYVGNEEWTSSLGFPVKEGWRSWTVNEQVAGYVTTYDANDFTFITVKGSGHMVPEYRPEPAFALFQRFITGQPF